MKTILLVLVLTTLSFSHQIMYKESMKKIEALEDSIEVLQAKYIDNAMAIAHLKRKKREDAKNHNIYIDRFVEDEQTNLYTLIGVIGSILLSGGHLSHKLFRKIILALANNMKNEGRDGKD